jgi:hypothetical protein
MPFMPFSFRVAATIAYYDDYSTSEAIMGGTANLTYLPAAMARERRATR